MRTFWPEFREASRWFYPSRLLVGDLGICFWVILVAFTAFSATSIFPEGVSFLLAFFAILILPGIWLSAIFPQLAGDDWLKRLPIAFALSYSIWALPSFVLMRLHATWKAFNFTYLVINILLICAYLVVTWDYRKSQAIKQPKAIRYYIVSSWSRVRRNLPTLVLLGLLLVALGTIIPLASNGFLDGDVLTHVAMIRNMVETQRFSLEEPLFGAGLPYPTRGAANPWLLLPAFLSQVTQIDPIPLINVYLPPTLAILAVLALYLFVFELSGDRRLALFSAIFFVVYLAAEPFHRHGNSSYILFRRLISDKHFLMGILLPISLVLCIRYLKGGNLRDLFLAGLISLGISLTHALITLFFLTTITVFSIAYYLVGRLNKGQPKFSRVGIVILLAIWMMAIPLVQSTVEKGRSAYLFVKDFSAIPLVNTESLITPFFSVPSLGVPGNQVPSLADIQVEKINPFLVRRLYSQIKAEGLLVLSPKIYTNHPDLIWDWGTLISLVLTPFLLIWAIRARHHQLALYLFLAMLLCPVIIFNPFLTPLIGRFVTPWLVYRFTWLMPTALVLAFFLYQFSVWLERLLVKHFQSGSQAFRMLPVISLTVFTILLWPQIREFSGTLMAKGNPTEIFSPRLISYIQENISQQAGDSLNPKTILSDYTSNQLFAAQFDKPNLIAHRYNTTSEEFSAARQEEALARSLDVDYFSEAVRIDQRIVNILNRYGSDFMLLRTDRALTCQLLSLPTFFEKLYADDAYHLFRVKKPLADDPVIEANTLLNVGELEDARKAYEVVLESNPSSILARLSLGEIYVRSGNPKKALEHFQVAYQANPQEACFVQSLADGYFEVGDLTKAAEIYQQAINLAPRTAQAYRSLGDIYLLQERVEDAEAAYKRSIEIWLEIDPYSLKEMFPKQASRVERKVDTRGDSINSGDWLASSFYDLVASYYQGGSLDNDSFAAAVQSQLVQEPANNPFISGLIANSSGKKDEAVSYYQQAIQSDPGNNLIYHQLGLLYESQEKYPEALAAFQRSAGVALLKLNWAMDARLHIGNIYKAMGDEERALQAFLETASFLLPVADPYIEIAKIYRERGDTEMALAVYDWAIRINPRDMRPYLEKGELYAELGDREKALANYNAAIQLDPKVNTGWDTLAQFYLDHGDYTNAQQTYDRSLEIFPANVKAHLGLASVYHRQGLWDAMLSQARQAIIASPNQSTAYLLLGDAYQGLDQIDLAKSAYQRAIQLNPGEVNAYVSLARLQRSQGHAADADALIGTALEKDPDSASAMVEMANVYQTQGQFAQAAEMHRKALDADPELVAAYLGLADLELLMHNDQAAAEKLYQTILAAEPDSLPAYLALGNFYIKTGQLDSGRMVFEQLVSQFPDEPYSYFNLNKIYQIDGQWDLAKQTLQNGIDRIPNATLLYNALANLHLHYGDVASAQNLYQQAIAIDRFAVDSYIGLAQLAQASGNLEQSRDVYEELVSNNPDSAEAHIAVALFLESQADLTQAEEHLRHAVLSDPNNLDAYTNLGQFLQRQNRSQEAYEAFQSGLSLFPANPSLHLLIADYYLSQGQDDVAQEWYQKAQSLDASNPYSALALGDYYQSRNNNEAALESLIAARSIAPENPEVYMALGDLYQKFGLIADAETQYKAACELDRSRIECQVSLGQLYLDTGRWIEAFFAYKRALSISPLESSGYLGLAKVIQKMGGSVGAERILTDGVNVSLDEKYALLGRGEYYISQHAWDRARTDFEAAWRSSSDSQDIGERLSQFLMERGNWEQAALTLYTIMQESGSEPDNLIRLGNLFASQAKWTDAIQSYEEAVSLDPSTEEAFSSLAYIYALLGEQDLALVNYQAAVEADPDDPGIWIELGDYYLTIGEYDQAVDAHRQANQLDPTLSTPIFLLSSLTQGTGMQDDELKHLESEAEEYPSIELLLRLGEAHQMRGEWITALSWYNKAIDLEPLNGDAWLALGNYYRETEQWEKALASLNKAIQFQPASFTVWWGKGVVLEKLGQNDEASRAYQQAIDLDRGQISGYASMALLQANANQFDAALETIHQGLLEVPGSVEGYQVLAQIYALFGDLPRAMQTLEEGLVVMPGAADLHASQGDLLVQQALGLENVLEFAQPDIDRAAYTAEESGREPHPSLKFIEAAQEAYNQAIVKLNDAQEKYPDVKPQLDEARIFYERALQIQPGNLRALFGLGSIAAVSGDLVQAAQYYAQAARLYPQNVQAWINLGNIYLQLDRLSEAVDVFRTALAISPFNPGAQLGLANANITLGEFNLVMASDTVQNSHSSWKKIVDLLRLNIQ